MDAATPTAKQAQLEELLADLMKHEQIADRLEVLNTLPQVKEYLQTPGLIPTFLAGLSPGCDYAVKSIIALGQAPRVFACPEETVDRFERLRELLQVLVEVEKFYGGLGGIIGYHVTFMKLLEGGTLDEPEDNLEFQRPPGFDISEESPERRKAVRWGVENLPLIGEIYAVGGAGDRLDLHHEETGEPLPAAKLLFMGRTLIEGLIRDLESREYLYYKLTGKRLLTPIAMMTSDDKENHAHIMTVCESFKWFGRPRDSFFFFQQSGVPVLSDEGEWVMIEPLKLALKPGGHGLLWKLAEEAGVFNWFKSKGRVKALVRQINNPVADTDGGILPFIGFGMNRNKAFGFASCLRLVGTAEGVNVLRKRKSREGPRFCITNVEYTEFSKRGMEDAAGEDGVHSAFPANTNILLADLEAVCAAQRKHPIPGLLVNAKLPMKVANGQGRVEDKLVGRLESTMQNIADFLEDPRNEPERLRTFLTYNHRHKTISVTKKSYKSGEALEETPEGCFLTVMKNYRDLFVNECGMQVPPITDDLAFVKGSPPFVASLHPGLGTLYSVLSQKIRGGRLAQGAELFLEIAELQLNDVDVEGSLWIHTEGLLSPQEGRCQLHRVAVRNRGLNTKESLPLWRHRYSRREGCEIVLHRGAEFFAQDVIITGMHRFEVPPGHRMVLMGKGENWEARLQPIDRPTWSWRYGFDEENHISLSVVRTE